MCGNKIKKLWDNISIERKPSSKDNGDDIFDSYSIAFFLQDEGYAAVDKSQCRLFGCQIWKLMNEAEVGYKTAEEKLFFNCATANLFSLGKIIGINEKPV